MRDKMVEARLDEPQDLNAVRAFHRLFRMPVLERPTIPSSERCALRVALLEEELEELKRAIEARDLVGIADALCDLQYVLSGAVLEFGLGGLFKELFDEVQSSNMSKACRTLEEARATVEHYRKERGVEAIIREVDGQFLVYRKSDHKVLKSINYRPANLERILQGASRDKSQ